MGVKEKKGVGKKGDPKKMCSRKFTKGKLRSWINELKKDRGKEYERVTRRRRLKMKDRSLNKM